MFANAPKVANETIFASTTEPTGYLFLRISHGLSSMFLKPSEIFFVSSSRALIVTSTVSPTLTTSDGCLILDHESSEICIIPSMPPRSTNAP